VFLEFPEVLLNITRTVVETSLYYIIWTQLVSKTGAFYPDITITLSGNGYLVTGTMNMLSAVISLELKWSNATPLEILSKYPQITKEFALSSSPLSVGLASVTYLAFQSSTSISVHCKPHFLIFAIIIVTGLVVMYGR